jgi:hypothetical protein
MTKAEFIAERLVDDAVRGKMSALKIFLDRTEGKAPTQAQIIRRNNKEESKSKFTEKENQDLVNHFKKVFSEDYPTQ